MLPNLSQLCLQQSLNVTHGNFFGYPLSVYEKNEHLFHLE